MLIRFLVLITLTILLPSDVAYAGAEDTTRIEFIRIAAVGDIMMGTTFPEDSNFLSPDDGATILAAVADSLAEADITFGNLEGCLFDSGTVAKDCGESKFCYAFRMPERYVAYLVGAGFDILSLANNHARDFGLEGLENTIRVLDSVGIAHAGIIGDIAHLEHEGIRVAVIGFAPYDDMYDLLDIEQAASIVSDLSESHDIVIVSFHGGGEGPAFLHVPDSMEIAYEEERGELKLFARAVIDAGADLILGHGPHVPRGMEIYKNRLIAYSLGNFCTYEMFNLKGPRALTGILKTNLAPDGCLLSARIVPCFQEYPGIPKPDSSGAIIPLLNELSQADFGSSAALLDSLGYVILPAVTSVNELTGSSSQ